MRVLRLFAIRLYIILERRGEKEEQKKKMANACLFYSQTHASRLNSEVQNRKKRKINGRFITHSEFIQ